MELNFCYKCMHSIPSGETVCPDCGNDNAQFHNTDDILREGTILSGKYFVGRSLGRGGFAVTYLGLDLALGVRVAIKEFFPVGIGVRVTHTNMVTTSSAFSDTNGFTKGCEEFQSEAKTLALFNSPNIVHVRDNFRENGTSYIVMDYIEGNLLSTEIINNGGRLSWQRVFQLFGPLIQELDQLHKKNIIHRDIKPDNLRIYKDEKGDERLILLDFGAARSFASKLSLKTYTAMVTPGYAPIEQYSQKSRQGPFTDIYGICSTMYAAITGEVPPSSPDRVIGATELKPFSNYGINVPESFEKAIFHGLAVYGSDRPQSMKTLYYELTQTEPIPKHDRRWMFLISIPILAAAVFFLYNSAQLKQNNLSATREVLYHLTQTADGFQRIMSQTAAFGQTEIIQSQQAEQTVTAIAIQKEEDYLAAETQKALTTQTADYLMTEQILQTAESTNRTQEAIAITVNQTETANVVTANYANQTQTAAVYATNFANQTKTEAILSTGLANQTQTAISKTLDAENAMIQTQTAIHFTEAITPEKTKTTTATNTPRPTSPLPAQELYQQGLDFYNDNNYTEAAKSFGLAAEKGHSDAQYQLGICYLVGEGVEQDAETAVYWLQAAADQGNSAAQRDLGYCYANGDGVDQDYEKAVYWFQKSADKGFADAQINLGLCYYNGLGVSQDYEEALSWFQKAADQNNPSAQNYLGICYYNGTGVTQDFDEAVKWWKRSAEQNHASAQNNLGYCYQLGNGVEQDYDEAVKWYRLAADQDNFYAQSSLGYFYETGKGVTQDNREAAKWHLLAANQGSPYSIGFCYFNGYGIRQNYTTAAEYFQMAAEQDDIAAQISLGICYRDGKGVEKDIEEAEKWFSLACESKDQTACDYLENLRK